MSIKNDDIAVIGMSGRFPGANSVAEFWDNLCAKKNSIRLLSDKELRAAGVPEQHIADSTYVKACALLDDVEMFDAGFFKVSPLEAEVMDPQVRLLLQCAWETLEDAGHARREAQNIGVFAGAGGVTTGYFSNFVNLHPRFERITASPAQLGNDKDFLATYLSYKLNLTGPSVTVQTACSTSLVALHQARLSLLNGECEMALAGGVTVRVPHGQGYHHREGYIFSRSGSVRAFDAGADGVVFGSGLGLVLLRRLSDALADGDHIHAVIKGSAITNDGKGKLSYAASSARGQIACVRAALKNAAADPAGIGFVESHGTGTAMGDPEEVKALSSVFREHTDRKAYCALGAVKTNVGHAEAAAGIIGFIKTVLAVQRGVIPPTVHYATPNPRIRFENTPFYVNGELQPWPAGPQPRLAAVNSLGVGGTNAFVVVQQHVPAPVDAQGPAGPVVVPLSARTEASLQAYARRLAGFLAAAGAAAPGLAEMAYTLQTGRDAMERRVAFVVSSIGELRAALERYLEGGEAAAGAAMADDATACAAMPDDAAACAASPNDAAACAASPNDAAACAAAWTAGADVDWLRLYGATRPRRASLPTYVFAKDRHWAEAGSAAPARAPALHPLLHANTSDLSEQKYSASFSGDEFFLRDHQVRTGPHADGTAPLQKVLPGVACLEMARAAIERAMPSAPGRLELRHVAWLQPVVVAGEQQVHVAVLPGDPAGPGVDFEVYTGDEQVHCQGQGVFVGDGAAPEPVDVARLKAALQPGGRTAGEIYAAFADRGLHYGPAHRPVVAAERGDGQLLAQLVLPQALAADGQDYLLHPSLMDGALQAAALLLEADAASTRPLLPFALETLRVVAPCRREMLAWVRRAAGTTADGPSARLDIDLMDLEGRVSVQMRGYTPRALAGDSRGSLLATQEWVAAQPPVQPVQPAAEPAEPPHTASHVIVCNLPQVDVQQLAPQGLSPQCLSLQLDPAASPAARYDELALACFGRLQELVRGKPQADVLLQLVLPHTPEQALQAGLAGLFRTARLENPRIAGQVVFVDPGIGTAALARLLHAEGRHAQDTLVRHEAGARQVARWRLLPEPAQEPAQAGAAAGGPAFDRDGPFKDHGVYLITGGLGGLGVLWANHILDRTPGARLVLTGRAPLADVMAAADRRATLQALQARGAVEYRPLDLDDLPQVEQLVAAILREHRQLNGVVHSAGMTADSFLLKKTAGEFRRVLAPKTTGTHHLDQATRDVDLDFLLLFSSLTAAVGNLGQADYAAANGFLDGFAAFRNQQVKAGLRRGLTLAIRWPLWQQGGMQLDAAGRERLHQATGTRPLQTATGLRLFHRSLALGLDQVLVMEGDLPAMQRCLGLAVPAAARAAAAPAPARETAVPPAAGDLVDAAGRYLCAQIASLLKLPVHKLDPRAPLEDHGIDSILALDLTRLIEQHFGTLPKTLFFEYLTVHDLAGYFVREHAAAVAALAAAATPTAIPTAIPTATPAAHPAAAPAQPQRPSRRRRGRRFADEPAPARPQPGGAAGEPIAIVGLSGRYPESRDLQAFWRHLRDGRDCIVEVPAGRWDWRDYYSEDRAEKGRHHSKWGGFIEGVDEFDARFFNISPLEAETIDPQERLFLQHAWMAMEDAGCTRAALQAPSGGDLPAQVGVYAGVMYGEYQLFGAEASLQGRRMGFASNLASIANRVSYVLNLHGPSMVVDTMCSSSLTAIHLACQDLKQGRTALGIAGGVNVTLHPNKYLMLSAGQFISGDGHCQSFGEGGDGYIPGEGVGVVVLKRLSDAERDGNPIYGLILGSALSHGGKTNGYTVPNPQAQASAIRQALAEAGVAPRHVSYIEAHGTGTRLGDPIEIAALTKVFQEHTPDTGFCMIGSAKSNIGHAEAAAGIAGLTKVLLQLKHRSLVPSLHSSRLNPHIDFERTPFIVNQALKPWDAPVVDGRTLPRIAGISSFGAGGSNAHLIVQEYVAPGAGAAAGAGVGAEHIVPLSARTADQLRQKASELLDFIREQAGPLPMDALAYTLQVGREAMDHRLAVLADSSAALAERLQAWLDEQPAAGLYQAQAKDHKDTLSLLAQDADLQATVAKWVAGRQHARLAELWTRGLALDWAGLHARRPALMSLPTYPFARQRFWVDTAPAAPALSPASTTAQLHPLLHRNTSDFDQLSYASEFGAEAFFLAGEAGRRSLGEAACLEMARAAIGQALPPRAASAVLELRELAWAQPAAPLGGAPVRIALFDRVGEQLSFEIFSAADGTETVHCQGRAAYTELPAPAALDLAAIAAGAAPAGQLLPPLELPAELQPGQAAFGLHPALLQQALQAAARCCGTSAGLHGLAALRSFAPGRPLKWAWVRPAGAGGPLVDIDLCDEQGQVGVQLRGLRHQALEPQPQDVPPAPPAHDAAGDTVREAVHEIVRETAPPARLRLSDPSSKEPGLPSAQPLRRITLAAAAAVQPLEPASAPQEPAAARDAARAKPSHIVLAAPSAPGAGEPVAPRKPMVLLAPVAAGSPAARADTLACAARCTDRGDGVFSIRLEGDELSAALIDALLSALRTVEQSPAAKVLLLEGGDGAFLTGGLAAHRDALAAGLYRALAACPVPVIAVVRGDALGAGFLVAALCDFMACSSSARLAFALPGSGLQPGAAEALLAERFGRVHASDFLYLTPGATAAELQARGWSFPVRPREQVAGFAQALAANLAQKSQAALRLLKQHLARGIAAAAQQLPPADASLPPAADASLPPAEIAAPSPRILLQQHGRHVLHVRMLAPAGGDRADELLADLSAVFACIDAASPVRCVVLSSAIAGFLPPAGVASLPGLAQGFAQALQALDRPVVVALDGDAQDLAWYAAQCCDACVYSEAGRYAGGDLLRVPALAGAAAAALSRHLGRDAAARWLLAGAQSTGAQLRSDHGALHVAAAGQALPQALALSEALAAFAVPELSAWKQRAAALLPAPATLADEAAAVDDAAAVHEAADPAAGTAPVAVPLESAVVSATLHPGGIVEVRMADREARNMFSDAFSRGLREVFAHVERSAACKVVVLTGYDNYFSSGGTQDTLLAIQQGQVRFTDNPVFRLPLDCPVPVIAAMQGHGIGAGWALGMYADFALFSDESRYFSPYMGYGFTPGAGSTLLFPQAIGADLGRETLMTAQEHSGGELKARGLPHPVLPREQVLPAAMALARRVAAQPRICLAAIKRRRAQALRDALPQAFEHELAMHERTFVGQADTLAKIQGRFGAQAASSAPSPLAATPALPAAAPSAAAPAGVPALDELAASLRSMLAHELRMEEGGIGDDEPFVDLGLDSITGVTWIRRINDTYGTAIEAIQVYSHPTLAQLSRHVHAQAQKVAASRPAAPAAAPAAAKAVPVAAAASVAAAGTAADTARAAGAAPRTAAAAPVRLASWRAPRRPGRSGPAAGPQAIAVIGMAGRFAKARNLDEFWQNLAQGRDCIDEVPAHRWDIDRYYQPGEAAPGKTNSRWMGVLDDVDRFDAAFFNISPREARSMDPQQRLFLQACWHGIEHAGYNPRALGGSRCGVFAGSSAGDYHQLSRREQLSGQGFTGAAPSILAARISYCLDLHGPSLSIDTACSSSLVAIAAACDSLVLGGSDLALAGGVNVMAGPAMQIMTAQVGMLSPRGRCYSFDARADGIASGEGVGVVVLKRLADAQRDGDCIYGVIEGWGVNQDGKTNGITAPNADAQARLQREVYDRFGIDPAGIQLIEAHGTGTALGDPIEVAGLKASFQPYTQRAGYCALGSVKSSIGHCLTAAGVSGFLKTLLALEHRQLPPAVHFERLNPHISLQGTPFYVNERLRDWARDGTQPRRAAVNSFGFSGTNAHVVVAEYRGPQADAPTAGTPDPAASLVPLSARTAAQLLQQARELLDFLRGRQPAQADLRRIACTLQLGREPMNERAAFVVRTVAELQQALQAFIARESGEAAAPGAPPFHRGQAGSGKDALLGMGADPDFRAMVDKWIARQELARLADLWTRGLALDWNAFHAGAGRPRRIGLPGYPFARERHWIEADAEVTVEVKAEAAAQATLPQPARVQLSPVQSSAAQLAPVPLASVPPVPRQEPPLPARRQPPASPPAIPLPQLQRELQASLAEALFMEPADVGMRKPFVELGLDSIIGVEWVKTLNKRYGTAVPATRIYDHPSVAELAAFLHAQIATGEDQVDAESVPAMQPAAAEPAPLPAATPALPRDVLQQQLRDSLAEALFLAPADVNVDQPFNELGLDSIIGVEWVKAINKRYGSTMSATRIYDHPSVRALAQHLHAGMAEAAPPAVPAPMLAAAPAPVPQPAAAAAAPAIGSEQLQRELRASLAEALFMEPADVGVDQPFNELGLDSIIGVEWVKDLNRRYGTQLSATRIYDHPSVRALAAHLAGEMAPPEAPAAPPGARHQRTGSAGSAASAGLDSDDLYFHATRASGDLEADGELSLHYALSPDTNVCLKEHVVFGRHLLPTDAYIELVLGACRGRFGGVAPCLRNLSIANPMLGEPGRDTHVKLVLRRAGHELQFFVKSSPTPDFAGERLHMQGFIAAAQPLAPHPFDDGFAVERTLAAAQIPTNTGRHYAPLQSLQLGAVAALGLIRVAPHAFGFVADPFVVYGGLCTVINHARHLAGRAGGDAGDDQFLPYRIGRVTVAGPLDGSDYRCRARARSVERDAMEFDFEIADAAGRPVAAVEAIVLRRVARSALQPAAAALPAPVPQMQQPQPSPARGRATAASGSAEKIAIIGMSCRYPMSENADALWQNLKAGRDCVSEVPPERWGDPAAWHHPDPRHPHTSYSRWAGLLDRIDTFDALFFGISPAEAELMDPQQRIFLEECWKAIESAGHAPGSLSNRACGVYVGCGAGDYARVLAGEGQDTAGPAFMGTSSAILAARIAYHLNLKGPAIAIDTACSSSLVAVHLACESIRSGDNELALAGGINLLATPLGHILTSQVGMPSKDGRSASFDASANGIVFSEGCGVLLLKALSAAQRDNDPILGVIAGSGTNQDGKTNGITAPSSLAQEQLLRQVYGKFGIDPRRISYVEAHGTATPLGDPIEVNALGAVFGRPAGGRPTCALGSVKSNLGHTGFAAGVAGIVKVLLCLQHRKLVPSIHYSQPNPHIEFERSPFEVGTQYRDWHSDGPRLAAVSSFGFSGTNAHVVIEEHVQAGAAPSAEAGPGGQALVPLSAKTAEQLQQQVRELLDFIRRQPAPGTEPHEPLTLAALACTLQLGRDAMDHRLALVVGSLDELAARLQAIVDGAPRVEGLRRGQASRIDDTLAAFAADADLRDVIERWIAQKNLAKIADLWVKGVELDLQRLHSGVPPRRLRLPTYPFAKDRCWVAPSAPRGPAGGGAAAEHPPLHLHPPLHPLVHRNTSTLGQQGYSSRFTGREFFADDHRVQGQRVLPAVAYLEMAHAALVDAMGGGCTPFQLELRHVAWAQPLAVGDDGRRVDIAVFSEDGTELGFEVGSGPDGEPGGESGSESGSGGAGDVLHCQGSAAIREAAAAEPLDLPALRARMDGRRLAGAQLYPRFAALGLQYGPAFQGIAAVHLGLQELLVELVLPQAARAAGGGCLLHPGLMDSALQGAIVLADELPHATGRPALPFALESLRVLAACTEHMLAWVRPAAAAAEGTGPASGLVKVDIDLCRPDGHVCVQMRGFSSRPLDGPASPADGGAAFDEAHYRSVIDGVLSQHLTADAAVELG
jgi:acyl transferase domain-containing protein/enoyl-CoA hydratase/carnithine racemase